MFAIVKIHIYIQTFCIITVWPILMVKHVAADIHRILVDIVTSTRNTVQHILNNTPLLHFQGITWY